MKAIIEDHRVTKRGNYIAILQEQGIYNFRTTGNWFLTGGTVCNMCNSENIHPIYIYIIEMLAKAGLLEEDYPFICYHCKKIAETFECSNYEDIIQYIYDVYKYEDRAYFFKWFNSLNSATSINLIEILKKNNIDDEEWLTMLKLLLK